MHFQVFIFYLQIKVLITSNSALLSSFLSGEVILKIPFNFMFYIFSKKFDIFLIKNRSIFLIKYGSKIVSIFLPSLFFIQMDKKKISFLLFFLLF
jgi:hypothetical protein